MEDTNNKFEVGMTHRGYHCLYQYRVAKENEICINPSHGHYWTYSTKDPGNGKENVIIATTDQELLQTHPELGKNELFNDKYL